MDNAAHGTGRTDAYAPSDRAIVIGGSVGGLLAAAALSAHYRDVVVIEQDRLSPEPAARRGVPQGRQVHVALPLGLQLIDELQPGIVSELQERGCPLLDEARDIGYLGSEGWHARTKSDAIFLGFTRPLFEAAVRDRITNLTSVRIEHARVSGLAISEDCQRVTGVTITGESAPVCAELVVDASGRGSKATKWLQAAGYAPPPEQHVKSFMGYASVRVELDADALPGGLQGILAFPIPPADLRGGVLLPAENGIHVLAAIGQMRDYPPRTYSGVLEFLKGARTPILHEVAAGARPLSEVATYHMSGNTRCLWERLTRRPAGFLALGDAVAAFNPSFGQGITVAAAEATELRRQLVSCDRDPARIPDQYHQAITPIVDVAFDIAASEDALYDGAELHNVEPPDEQSTEYATHMDQLATRDPLAVAAIERRYGWLDESAFYSPEMKRRVQAWVSSGRAPANSDPVRPPATVC